MTERYYLFTYFMFLQRSDVLASGTSRKFGPFHYFNALFLLCKTFLLLADFPSLEAPCLLTALVMS